MKLRFVDGGTALSDIIEAYEGRCEPFTPSHVEIVVEEGYLGADIHDGVQIRPFDYAPFRNELFATMPLRDEVAAEVWARSKIGMPYDWPAILDFVLPTDFNEPKHTICSAFCVQALAKGQAFFREPAVPPHAISPRDLLLMVTSRYVFLSSTREPNAN